MTNDKPHILVVDDNPRNVDVARRVIESYGYRVSGATDGKAALNILERDEPDTVLLDICMPGMSGREVCQRMREVSNKVRIVYWSESVSQSNSWTLAEFKQEADDILGKPTSAEEMLSKITHVLNITH